MDYLDKAYKIFKGRTQKILSLVLLGSFLGMNVKIFLYISRLGKVEEVLCFLKGKEDDVKVLWVLIMGLFSVIFGNKIKNEIFGVLFLILFIYTL